MSRRIVAIAGIAGLSAFFCGCGGSGGGGGGSGGAGCEAEQARCSDVCVDLSSNPSHCGACSRSCGGDEACAKGTCVAKVTGCAGRLLDCSGTCVDASSDRANCGECGAACAADQSCFGGTCVCSAGTVRCAGVCADIATDAANCGACGVSCGPYKSCVGARCVCERGRVLCGSFCADIESDVANCGGCGLVCTQGQSCEAARCTGGGESGPDGCRGLALGISVSQVAVYQTVSVPVMRDGDEVVPTARNADVIAGRDALFRVFATPDAQFLPRPLSARVFVQNGSVSNLYFAKATIEGPSDEAALASTFQVTVPKSEIASGTRYAVELVECTESVVGVSRRPRFPLTGDVALGARETGGLKIHLVPVVTEAYVPDTSELALAGYRAAMLAMYPITSLDFSVGSALATKDPTDWTRMLDQVRSRRELDKPAADVYYYGLVRPTATLKEYCASGCTAGVGFVPQGSPSQQAGQRVAVGIAFADVPSAETMAHEVGHNHGRDHAPCPDWGITGVDPSYPYARAATGVYGWDSRYESLMPPTASDIMGYCTNKWISDYTYRGLTDRVAWLNGGAFSEIISAPGELFLVLLVDSRGVRWGAPRLEPGLPVGQPEPASVVDELGRGARAVTVYRTRVSDLEAYSIQVPAQAAVRAGARLRLRDGNEIAFE